MQINNKHFATELLGLKRLNANYQPNKRKHCENEGGEIRDDAIELERLGINKFNYIRTLFIIKESRFELNTQIIFRNIRDEKI